MPEFLPCLVVESYSTTIINVLNNTVTTYLNIVMSQYNRFYIRTCRL